MPLTHKMVGDVAVVELAGKLMGGHEATEIRDKISELIAAGHLAVVADMTRVTWMNATGLGCLMAAMTSLRNKRGDLRLANIQNDVENLLVITKLATIFDTFDTVELAIASFKK